MDTMQIKSELGRSIVSKIIRNRLKNKFKSIQIDLEDLDANFFEDGYLKLHVEGYISIHESDLIGLLLGGK